MTDPSTHRSGAPTWMRVLLVVSLALNLLIAGVVVGAIASGRAGGPPRVVDLNLGPLTRALDPEDRRAIGHALRSREDIRPPRPVERLANARALGQALRAEPFDRDMVARLLDSQRSRAADVFLAGQEALLDRLEQMTPEERRAFADRLGQELRSTLRSGGRDRGPNEDGDRD